MNLWEKESQDKRHRRIAPIGATRWWAKHDALKKVYGSFGKPQDSLYVDVLFTLTSIQEQKTAKSNLRTKARGYKEGLLRMRSGVYRMRSGEVRCLQDEVMCLQDEVR
ncbi:hypothetical protein NHX12_006664 [Muraenolepis orangiensis]|nr:hypothetical protein NHX12_006664 [Muraenolepis orangiensis]